MTHQITLLGGQILPIYWGIIEKSPDVVHAFYTKETRNHLKIIERMFPRITFETHQVDPYDYTGIKDLTEKIIFAHQNDNFQLNLTSGTKVMALACQAVFSTLEFDVFYIDQKHRIFDMSGEAFSPVTNSINIKTFLELSGHKKFTSSKLSSFNKSELNLAKQIFDLTKSNSGINKIFKFVRQNCTDIENERHFSRKLNNGDRIDWKSNQLNLSVKNHKVSCNSKHAFKIVFAGLWWELVIADITKSWKRSIEQLLSVDIETKSSQGISKNEIDVVLNTGKNLVFIECKSGFINQSDINKIRAVNRLYGGVSSKSILVCRYSPKKELLEKCIDLGIEVFIFNPGKTGKTESSNLIPIGNINEINKKLDRLIQSLEI